MGFWQIQGGEVGHGKLPCTEATNSTSDRRHHPRKFLASMPYLSALVGTWWIQKRGLHQYCTQEQEKVMFQWEKTHLISLKDPFVLCTQLQQGIKSKTYKNRFLKMSVLNINMIENWKAKETIPREIRSEHDKTNLQEPNKYIVLSRGEVVGSSFIYSGGDVYTYLHSHKPYRIAAFPPFSSLPLCETGWWTVSWTTALIQQGSSYILLGNLDTSL